MQGAVLRCDGSAMIWRFGMSGSCLRISACKNSFVNTQMFSGGMMLFDPIERLLNQAALAEKSKNLLRGSLAAAWPEACSAAPGHDDPVSMIAIIQ